MKYFHFSTCKDRKQIRLREKLSITSKKYRETYISKLANIHIYGINASGKSRLVNSLIEHGYAVYNKNIIKFRATDSLADIFYSNDIDKKNICEILNLDSDGLLLSSIIRQEALIEKTRGAILIVDDIDKLTGKKLELCKKLLEVCLGFCISARDQGQVNATLRDIMKKNKRKGVIINLSSNTGTKDMSNYLFVFFVVFVFMSGWGELAILLIAGRLLLRGSK